MSWIFLKRFLKRPFQVASIIPSSPVLIRRVAGKFDFTQPRVIAEFGPGEGCHTREIVRRMHPESRLLLFELDAELADYLRKQFAGDPRVEVLNTDARRLGEELELRGLKGCDYVISGIPFSTMEPTTKRKLLKTIYDVLIPETHSAFIIYQYTNELRRFSDIFASAKTEYFLLNIPPSFITVFRRCHAPAMEPGRAAEVAA